MGAISKLAEQMKTNYKEDKLVEKLEEEDHPILQETGEEKLSEEGFSDEIKLKDVNYVIEVISTYSFQEWAELAKALYNIASISHFVKKEMYDLFMDFIRLFDIKMRITTNPEEIEFI